MTDVPYRNKPPMIPPRHSRPPAQVPETPPEPAAAEVRKAHVERVEGWLHAYGGLVDARQATAVLVGCVGGDDDEDDRRYVVRLKLPCGDVITLRLGPYEEAAFAGAVAEEVVRSLFHEGSTRG